MRKKHVYARSLMDIMQITDSMNRHRTLRIIFESVLILALSTGCWFTFFSMFANPLEYVISVVFITGVPIILYFISWIRRIGRYLIFYVFILVALFLLIMYKSVWNGLLVFGNIIIEVLNEELALGMIGFELSGNASSPSMDALMAFVPVSILVSAAIAYSVFYKEVVLGLIFTALPVVTGLCLKAIPSIWLLSLIFFAWTGLFVISTVAKPISTKKKRPLYIQNERQNAMPFIFLAVVMLLLLAMILMFSEENYDPPDSVDELKQRIIETEEHLRYHRSGNDETAELPLGDLNKTEPVIFTDNTVMEVRMDVPKAMYLRGFTGGFYESGRWTSSLDWAYSDEYKGISEWLFSKGFYPWLQMDALYRLSEDYDLLKVEVSNISGNSKYTYVPYEAAITGDIMPDRVNFFRDSGLLSKGFLGDREYSFTMFISEFDDYDGGAIENWLSGLRKKSGYSDYLEKERIYGKFVYDTYLTVTEGTEKSLKEWILREGGKTVSSVLFSIREGFTENYTYNLETESAPLGRDELDYFANESKTGNDVHFATAAAQIFRMNGIPARYAEGYYISPERVKLYTELDDIRMDIPDSYAHSWVEVYIDEVGWFPVEVVPGYFDMKKTETEQEEVDEKVKKQSEEFSGTEKPIENYEDEAEPEEKSINPLWFIPLFIILAVLLYEVIGRYRMNRLRRTFGSVCTEKQVYEMYRYVNRIIRFDDIKLPANPFEKAYQVSERYDGHTNIGFREFAEMVSAVRFGNKVWKDDEHKKAAAYVILLNKYIYERQTKFGKFLMKAIFFFV